MSATTNPFLTILSNKNNSVEFFNDLASKMMSSSLIFLVEIFKLLIENLSFINALIEIFVFTESNGNFWFLKTIIGLKVFISSERFLIFSNILTVFKSRFISLLNSKISFLILLLNFVV